MEDLKLPRALDDAQSQVGPGFGLPTLTGRGCGADSGRTWENFIRAGPYTGSARRAKRAETRTLAVIIGVSGL